MTVPNISKFPFSSPPMKTPRQPACQHCNKIRRGCDRQRPCELCRKKNIDCIYPADAGHPNATALQNQSETRIPDSRTPTTEMDITAKDRACGDGTLSSRPHSTPGVFATQHAVKPDTNRSNLRQNPSNQKQELETLDDTYMAGAIEPALTQQEDHPQNEDHSYQPPRQQRTDLKRLRSEDEHSYHGSDSESNYPAVCQPCRALKKGCEETRPCVRCVKAGRADKCIPTIPKQKRRRYNKDIVEMMKLGGEEVST